MLPETPAIIVALVLEGQQRHDVCLQPRFVAGAEQPSRLALRVGGQLREHCFARLGGPDGPAVEQRGLHAGLTLLGPGATDGLKAGDDRRPVRTRGRGPGGGDSGVADAWIAGDGSAHARPGPLVGTPALQRDAQRHDARPLPPSLARSRGNVDDDGKRSSGAEATWMAPDGLTVRLAAAGSEPSPGGHPRRLFRGEPRPAFDLGRTAGRRRAGRLVIGAHRRHRKHPGRDLELGAAAALIEIPLRPGIPLEQNGPPRSPRTCLLPSDETRAPGGTARDDPRVQCAAPGGAGSRATRA